MGLGVHRVWRFRPRAPGLGLMLLLPESRAGSVQGFHEAESSAGRVQDSHEAIRMKPVRIMR